MIEGNEILSCQYGWTGKKCDIISKTLVARRDPDNSYNKTYIYPEGNWASRISAESVTIFVDTWTNKPNILPGKHADTIKSYLKDMHYTCFKEPIRITVYNSPYCDPTLMLDWIKTGIKYETESMMKATSPWMKFYYLNRIDDMIHDYGRMPYHSINTTWPEHKANMQAIKKIFNDTIKNNVVSKKDTAGTVRTKLKNANAKASKLLRQNTKLKIELNKLKDSIGLVKKDSNINVVNCITRL